MYVCKNFMFPPACLITCQQGERERGRGRRKKREEEEEEEKESVREPKKHADRRKQLDITTK
jgi:hypothetical protein